jgi:G6PDH family F420-dependent oxidoreductase
MLPGGFNLGVGSGEALNEQILGDDWPEADVRLEMLAEAIEVMRELWTGEVVSREGKHYRVRHARIYTLPERPPPVLVSGFGPKSVDLAARIGDGYVTTSPDADSIERFRGGGGEGKLVQAGAKVCYGSDEAEARRTAHRLWPNDGLPGELAQVLPTPEHFEQAAELVTREMVADVMPCGPDLDEHLATFEDYASAGVDELYVQQVGGNREGFFDVYRREVLPRFR